LYRGRGGTQLKISVVISGLLKIDEMWVGGGSARLGGMRLTCSRIKKGREKLRNA